MTVQGEFELEAELWAPDVDEPRPGVVVCHPHPRQGGTMHNIVVEAVLSALVGRGIAGLRFNFRGTGSSGGAYDEGRGERHDVRAALEALRATEGIDGERVGLAGYSFGAVIAAAAADDSQRALALVSFPPGLTQQLTGRPAELLLHDYRQPLLFMSGSEDAFSPPDAIRGLVSTIGRNAELETIAGANHFWSAHTGALTERVGSFFAEHLREG